VARRRLEILARVKNPAANATSNRNATPIRSMTRAQSVETSGRLATNHRIFDRDGALARFPTDFGAQPLVDVRCGVCLLNALQTLFSIIFFWREFGVDFLERGGLFRKPVLEGVSVCTLRNHFWVP
jgi:hypothetical protein